MVIVRYSDSFADTLGEAVIGAGGHPLPRGPASPEAWPRQAVAVMVAAGGAEREALDALASLPLGEVPWFFVGADPSHRVAAAAVGAGARDYFALPEDVDLLRRSLDRLLREVDGRRAAQALAEDEREDGGFDAILGESPALREALEQGRRVARHRDVTVLIGGETGTGKELLARAIHYASPRAAEPFVEINCAAIPPNLLESELFGHEKGAFTGAVAAKPGLFELAHDGTLFLDEIGHMPIELQAKLLRALEQREIRRVGGTASRRVDVRVIAASHVDLPAAVARREFREDLYYRLNVVSLALPPLRARTGDVDLLTRAFVESIARASDLPVPEIGNEVRDALRAHAWPGNVRELRNAIERALILSPPGRLEAGALGLVSAPVPGSGELPFPADLDTIQRSAAAAMLELVQGNKSEAARRLGISRPRLQRLLDSNNH